MGKSHIEVRVGSMPGKIVDIVLNGDRKVSTALEAANLSVDGFSITVNDSEVTGNPELSDGDTVLLTKKVKGNS